MEQLPPAVLVLTGGIAFALTMLVAGLVTFFVLTHRDRPCERNAR